MKNIALFIFFIHFLSLVASCQKDTQSNNQNNEEIKCGSLTINDSLYTLFKDPLNKNLTYSIYDEIIIREECISIPISLSAGDTNSFILIWDNQFIDTESLQVNLLFYHKKVNYATEALEYNDYKNYDLSPLKLISSGKKIIINLIANDANSISKQLVYEY